jgi:hypothetical protein
LISRLLDFLRALQATILQELQLTKLVSNGIGLPRKPIDFPLLEPEPLYEDLRSMRIDITVSSATRSPCTSASNARRIAPSSAFLAAALSVWPSAAADDRQIVKKQKKQTVGRLRDFIGLLSDTGV